MDRPTEIFGRELGRHFRMLRHGVDTRKLYRTIEGGDAVADKIVGC